ncbi:MAG: hypothetical protein Q9174_002230 [Haloplaca sp. 1 TL-2023]
MASEEGTTYQPKDAISATVRSTMILGGAGLFLSAVQNSLTRQNVTGWGVITRTGSTIWMFGTIRSFPAILGFGAALSVLQFAFDYTGGKFTGYAKDAEVDEYERKEQLRRNRRRPIEQTLQEMGEGRGIYGPGYQERRRERLKQNLGIDVPETFPSPSPQAS